MTNEPANQHMGIYGCFTFHTLHLFGRSPMKDRGRAIRCKSSPQPLVCRPTNVPIFFRQSAGLLQLWAFRCYPAALQLNYLYSTFIMQSQKAKIIEIPFLTISQFIIHKFTLHYLQHAIHHSNITNRPEFYRTLIQAISPSCYQDLLCRVQPKAR